MKVLGVRNLLSVVVFLVVIVQYKLFIVQYKSLDFRAVSAATVKVPKFLLANLHHICPLLAEWMVNVFKISVHLSFNMRHIGVQQPIFGTSYIKQMFK